MAEIFQIIIIVLGTLVGFTIAGVVGFGGGIVVLPILVSIVGMQEAVPILTISQLSSNFPGYGYIGKILIGRYLSTLQ